MISSTRKAALSIEREDIGLTDRDIIKRYLGIDQFPCSIQSPIRQDDVRPSFSMKEVDGAVLWKDFGTGERGNAVSLMAKIWCVKYSEALLKIKLEFFYIYF